MQIGSEIVTSYRDFARALLAGGIVSDPWVDGVPRFRMTPVVLDRPTQQALYSAAEAVAALHAEAARLCARDSELVARFFALPPAYQLMWRMSAGDWHGIARADVFLTADGPKICELNSDTPSGEPEAIALNRAVDGSGAALFDDPNCELAERVCALVTAATSSPKPTIGIVYPTEMTEDLPMIELYARWFESRGMRVVLGSPFNLMSDGKGGVALFGVPCPVIWRHYKTDWWGERRPIWRSEDRYPDAEPLAEPLELLAGAVARRQCAVINPFGAVLTQNKRMMALLWEEGERFPGWAQAAVRRYLPFTARFERLEPERLRRERELWVLKSDYGCEGDEVIIGAETLQSAWNRAIADVIPNRWIAQRRFRALESWRGRAANYGVYVVSGRACGVFTRLQATGSDREAVCAPTLVRLS